MIESNALHAISKRSALDNILWHHAHAEGWITLAGWENSTRPRTLAQEAPGAYEAVIGYAQFVEPQGVPNMCIA